jgi:molybdopterin/thiamine biosynthesis adenylyltransferase
MDHTRHSQIFDASRLAITLIGAGGIGAAAGLTLAKMGVGYLEVWDDDHVSTENLATQFHRLSDIGRPKVEAFAEMVGEFSDDTNINTVYGRVGPDDRIGGDIVISAVDSIQARKDIWQAVFDKGFPSFNWYIDGRMAAEEAQLLVVNANDTAWYQELIESIDDHQFPSLPCTAKATIYGANLTSALIGAVVHKIVSNQDVPRIVTANLVNFAMLKV